MELGLSIAAIAIAIVTFALSFWHQRITAALSRKPVLVFVYTEDGWVLRNVGNGPALNVVVARKEPGGEWFQPVRVPPLGKDSQFPISWAAHVSKNRLGAA